MLAVNGVNGAILIDVLMSLSGFRLYGQVLDAAFSGHIGLKTSASSSSMTAVPILLDKGCRLERSSLPHG